MTNKEKINEIIQLLKIFHAECVIVPYHTEYIIKIIYYKDNNVCNKRTFILDLDYYNDNNSKIKMLKEMNII